MSTTSVAHPGYRSCTLSSKDFDSTATRDAAVSDDPSCWLAPTSLASLSTTLLPCRVSARHIGRMRLAIQRDGGMVSIIGRANIIIDRRLAGLRNTSRTRRNHRSISAAVINCFGSKSSREAGSRPVKRCRCYRRRSGAVTVSTAYLGESVLCSSSCCSRRCALNSLNRCFMSEPTRDADLNGELTVHAQFQVPVFQPRYVRVLPVLSFPLLRPPPAGPLALPLRPSDARNKQMAATTTQSPYLRLDT